MSEKTKLWILIGLLASIAVGYLLISWDKERRVGGVGMGGSAVSTEVSQ